MVSTPGKVECDCWQVVEERPERITKRADVRMRQDTKVLRAVLGNAHLADESSLASLRHCGELVTAKRAFNHL